MLAQGQSSSAKRGGLAADVSSGLIFLKKKNKNKTALQMPLLCFLVGDPHRDGICTLISRRVGLKQARISQDAFG